MSRKHWDKNYDGKAIKKVKTEDAIGTFLAHDITEVRPGSFKGTVFNAGHKVKKEDLQHLRRLGKNHLFVLNLGKKQIHENDAAVEIATALVSPSKKHKTIYSESEAIEGKIQLKAKYSGLFKINANKLFKLNMMPNITCVSIHNNTYVTNNSTVASIKIIPLFIDKPLLDNIVKFISKQKLILNIKTFQPLKIHLIITGNEIYDGIVRDGFETVVKNKLRKYGSNISKTVILPDDPVQIGHSIKNFLGDNSDLVIITGGMSVDPDDVTLQGINKVGVNKIHYGAAATPGSMFQLAYYGNIPIVGIPACALYHKTTVFDLLLPRILIGEKLNDEDLAFLAHGGLCMNCKPCRYPCCPFGKG